MPRKRKTPTTTTEPTQDDTVGENVTTQVAPSAQTKGNHKIMALTPEQIREIYANRRTKGQYEKFLTEFLGSNEDGISVKEVWPQLNDKKASTLKQGFDNAKDRKEAPEGSEFVDIIVDGDNVFLMNLKLLTDNGVLEPGTVEVDQPETEGEPVEVEA